MLVWDPRAALFQVIQPLQIEVPEERVGDVALATLLVTGGFVAGGHLKFTFMPKVDADNLVAALTLPQGTTVEEAERAVAQLESSLESYNFV